MHKHAVIEAGEDLLGLRPASGLGWRIENVADRGEDGGREQPSRGSVEEAQEFGGKLASTEGKGFGDQAVRCGLLERRQQGRDAGGPDLRADRPVFLAEKGREIGAAAMDGRKLDKAQTVRRDDRDRASARDEGDMVAGGGEAAADGGRSGKVSDAEQMSDDEENRAAHKAILAS